MERTNYLFLLPIIFFFFQSVGEASIPTPEALFRNSSNKKIDGNFVVLNMSIEEVENHTMMEKTMVSEVDDKESESLLEKAMRKKGKLHIQLLLELGERDKEKVDTRDIALLQVEFSKKGFKKSDAIRSIYFPNFNNRVLDDTNLPRSLFYSILTTLVANEEEFIVNRVKSLVPNFKVNKELLNREKMELLEKYKTYLKDKKKEQDKSEPDEKKPQLEEEQLSEKEKYESPLKAKDKDKQKKIDELLDSRMYEIDKHVNLRKDGRQFFWKLKYDEMEAIFSNKDQKLRSLTLKTKSDPIEFKLRDYILFDGVHELPKTIYFRAGNQQLFEVKILGYKDFKNNGPSLSERASEYRENLREKPSQSDKKESETPLLNPAFIY